MGAWGTGIFSDDDACDIRDKYKELIGDGFNGEEATHILIEVWKEELEDIEFKTVFWLSLAATQWKVGRLEEKVKKKAIEIIDSDMNLDLWDDEEASKSDYKKRKNVLLKLKDQLLSPQPQVKKIKKVIKYLTEFELGDAFAYEYKTGKYVILKVVDIAETSGETSPICEVSDWIGETLPSIEEIMKLKPRKNKFNEIIDIYICQYKKNEYPRDKIKIIAKNLQVRQKENGTPLFSWSELDECLSNYFGFEKNE